MDKSELSGRLATLAQDHSVVALKTGTEIEDMDDAEIGLLREISAAAGLPLIVKIGGAEARRDMRLCVRLGVDIILAPMVETVYALSNFAETAAELAPGVRLAINLESVTAVRNFDTMMATSAFASLNQVTIGRGDLSKSMNLDVNDEEVNRTTRNVLHKLKHTRKASSVGGGLTVANIEFMSDFLPSDRFNTRHMVLENSAEFRSHAGQSLIAALAFEKDLYALLARRFPERTAFYRKRIEILDSRSCATVAGRKPALPLIRNRR